MKFAQEEEPSTLVDALLAEQRTLTAVERFSQKHERAELPLQSRYYRDLIPLSQPGPGEQYAFEVDLDKCSGCKACVAACHSLNGLEPGESWRSVGLLVTEETAAPFQQTVTTACHHCVDPACLNGCPVLAYDKDPITGIVKHLDDQCIGCQYCVLKCPYEVPRFSSRLGIVRKCDMCSSRLSAGEAPACVQSCPNEAIRITVVGKETVRAGCAVNETVDAGADVENPFLPAAPAPGYSLPATRYVSAKGLPGGLRAGDTADLRPAEPHWPLVWMLVLTQAGIGGLWVESILAVRSPGTHPGSIMASGGLILAGLLASVLHLGRPFQAWRAFMGVRRSWLSREVVAFGALAPLVLGLLALAAWPFVFRVFQGGAPSPALNLALLVLGSLAGAAALACSVMVYVDTPRAFWRWPQTVPRFLGTALLLGLAVATIFRPGEALLFAAISAVCAAKAAAEVRVLRHLAGPAHHPLARTARLLAGPLAPVAVFRSIALIAGGVLLAQYAFAGGGLAAGSLLPAVIFTLLFAGEIAERSLFFRSVAQPIMPGGLP